MPSGINGREDRKGEKVRQRLKEEGGGTAGRQRTEGIVKEALETRGGEEEGKEKKRSNAGQEKCKYGDSLGHIVFEGLKL